MKRFLFLGLLGFILLASLSSAMLEYERFENVSLGEFASPNQTNWRGQIFRVGETGVNRTFTITQVGVYLNVLSTGNFTVILTAVNSTGLPNSTNFSVGSIVNPSGGPKWVNVTMTPYSLTRGSTYSLQFTSNGTTLMQVGINTGAPTYPGGNATESSNGGRSFIFGTYDVNFQVFGSESNVDVNLLNPPNNTITASPSIVFNASIFPLFFGQNATNMTFFVWNSTGAIFNQSTRFMTGKDINYSSVNISGFTVPGTYYWNALGCTSNATQSFCNTSLTNYSFIWGYTINQEAFDNVTSSGQISTFSLNLTTGAGLQATTAYLIWNGTSYPATITSSGNNYSILGSLTVPYVSGTTLVNWSWSVIFNTGFNFTKGPTQQTISSLLLDTCGTYTKTLMNLFLYDEDSMNPINGTIELALNLYTPGTSNLVTSFNTSFSYNFSQGPSRVCIQSLNTTYSMNYQTRYFSNVSNYVSEFKYGQAITISNTTIPQNISLYDLLSSSSTTFTINVQGTNLANIAGAIVDIQRQYVPLNQYISVETPLTDSAGKTVAHLVAKNAYYNFAVYKDGVLLGTFNNYIVKCANEITGDCSINLNLLEATQTLNNYQSYGNISAYFTFDRPNSNLAVNFISSDNGVHNVSWIVIKNDAYANNTICSSSLVGSIGMLSCSIPPSYGNSTVYAELYSDGVFLGRSFFSLAPISADTIGGTRVVLGMLMYSTVTLLMIGHPVTIVIGAILGIFFAGAFHIIDGGSFLGNSAVAAWFLVAGAIIIFYMRNKS